MARIRMQARFSIVVAFAFLLPAISYATDYIVGDGQGWSVGVDYTEWAKGKTFLVGDTLTFFYPAGQHTVVKVDGKGFNSCSVSPNSGVLTSGSDEITLTSAGNKWYICGVSGHCDVGQKLQIHVFPKPIMGTAPTPAPAPEVTQPSFPVAPSFPGAPQIPGAPAPSMAATPRYLPNAVVETPGSTPLLEPPAMPPLPAVPVPSAAPPSC